jgi:hypothetical protein
MKNGVVRRRARVAAEVREEDDLEERRPEHRRDVDDGRIQLKRRAVRDQAADEEDRRSSRQREASRGRGGALEDREETAASPR